MRPAAKHNGRHMGGRCYASGKHSPESDARLTG